MQCKVFTADLSLLGGSKLAGNMAINKNIGGCTSAYLINQSVTGLFEQKVDLLSL